jgi:hypothetical protein
MVFEAVEKLVLLKSTEKVAVLKGHRFSRAVTSANHSGFSRRGNKF